MTTPKISYVIASRNDNFCGDSVSRLAAVINFGVSAGDEFVIVDWKSSVPLSQAVGAKIQRSGRVRFIHVPVGAKPDHFVEVVAINVGIRRARGTYIGRIDQDTLVGERFVGWADRCLTGQIAPAWFSGRRDTPSAGLALPQEFPVNDDGVREGQPFYRCAVGILLAHRAVWNEVRGYDESKTGRLHVEHDLCIRLRNVAGIEDLGPTLNYPFYHQWHERPVGRPENTPESTEQLERRLRGIAYINNESWGMAGVELEEVVL